MEIEEVGYNPTKLALAIHTQLADTSGCIDAAAIALALDITEIRYEPLETFEGALVTQPERTNGSIVVNKTAGSARRRFTIAHELLHFLNDKHIQIEGLFQCKRSDIGHSHLAGKPGMDRHLKQEAQANRFAVELLAPKYRFKPFLNSTPEIQSIIHLSRELEVSKEATARRFVELSHAPVAVMFHKDDRLRYFNAHDDVPNFRLSKGHELPSLPQPSSNSQVTEIEKSDPSDWLWKPADIEITAQTLYQQDGFGMTLLSFDGMSDDDEQSAIEDTVERYTRWD
jgi:Zn-dependent peptidase ImmA (M78 family)